MSQDDATQSYYDTQDQAESTAVADSNAPFGD